MATVLQGGVMFSLCMFVIVIRQKHWCVYVQNLNGNSSRNGLIIPQPMLCLFLQVIYVK